MTRPSFNMMAAHLGPILPVVGGIRVRATLSCRSALRFTKAGELRRLPKSSAESAPEASTTGLGGGGGVVVSPKATSEEPPEGRPTIPVIEAIVVKLSACVWLAFWAFVAIFGKSFGKYLLKEYLTLASSPSYAGDSALASQAKLTVTANELKKVAGKQEEMHKVVLKRLDRIDTVLSASTKRWEKIKAIGLFVLGVPVWMGFYYFFLGRKGRNTGG